MASAEKSGCEIHLSDGYASWMPDAERAIQNYLHEMSVRRVIQGVILRRSENHPDHPRVVATITIDWSQYDGD